MISNGSKKMKYIAVAAFLLAVSPMCLADCSGEVCSSVMIEQIYVESGEWGNNNWIRTSGTETNLSGCIPDSGVYLWLSGNLSQKKEVLALLMMAYALDKPISVRVTNGARGCSIAYAYLDR